MVTTTIEPSYKHLTTAIEDVIGEDFVLVCLNNYVANDIIDLVLIITYFLFENCLLSVKFNIS